MDLLSDMKVMDSEDDLLSGMEVSDESDDLLSGMQVMETDNDLLNGMEVPRVGSNVEQERVEEKASVEKKENWAKGLTRHERTNDIAQGTYETGLNLVAGATAFIPAQVARHTAIGGSKIQNKINDVTKDTVFEPVMNFIKKKQEDLGIINPTTAEEQAEMGFEISDYIQSFGGTLQTPSSRSGKASLDLVSKGMEYVQDFSHWLARGVDAEKYPNAHNLLSTGTELMLFAKMHKLGKETMKAPKRLNNVMKKRVEGKVNKNEIKDLLKEKDDLLCELEAALEVDKVDKVKERAMKNQKIIDASSSFSKGLETPKQKVEAMKELIKEKQRINTFRKKFEEFFKSTKNDSGNVDINFMQKMFGRKPKAQSLYNRLIKEGLNENDMILSGLGDYLRNKGQEKVSWDEIRRKMKNSSFVIEKEVLENKPNLTSKEHMELTSLTSGDISKLTSEQNMRAIELTHKAQSIPINKTLYNEGQIPNAKTVLGGKKEGYKETLYRYKTEEGKFIEPHWNINGANKGNNVMAHDRRAYRKIINKNNDFKNSVHVEEVQSKWHDKLERKEEAVPDAPFKKSWYKMIMRDVISDAVRNNKDGISWNTGKIQHELYKQAKNTNFERLYDKKINKFFKTEYDVKPEKAIIEATNGPTEVWYVPVNEKMINSFKETSSMSAIDHMLAPLMNKKGAIEIEFSPKQVKTLNKLMKKAKEENKDIRSYLSSKGMEEVKVSEIAKMTEKIKSPMSSVLIPKEAPNDFTFFELKEGEMQSNITESYNGKKANGNVKVGNTDAIRFMDLPVTTQGEILKWFKTPENFFESNQGIRPLLDQAREIGKTIKDEKKVITSYMKEVVNKYPKKKLREEAGVTWHAMTELGKDAMKIMGKKIKENPEYASMKIELQPQFEQLLERVNEVREKLGKKRIPAMDDYLTFFAKESLITDMKQLFFGGKSEGKINLVMDDLATISQRHSQSVKDSTAFNHFKREGLRRGVKLELDPVVILDRYMNESLKHIHYSPLNAFIKEVTTQKLTIPGRKTTTLREYNPEVAKELISWSNKLAGKSNLDLPPALDRLINKATSNLTAAVLGGNLRTIGVQTTALVPTYVEYGAPRLMKATTDYISRADAPIKKSAELATRSMEAGIDDFGSTIAGSKWEKVSGGLRTAGLYGSSKVDYMCAEITWRAAWNSLKKEVANNRMTEKEAIRRADSAVVRLQGSGSIVNLSPAQRSALGKMSTLWQTFTINHANWVGKNVLGIKNPKVNKKQTVIRVSRYILGVAAVNTIMEDVIGIQSSFPAPVKTLVKGLKEGDETSAAILASLLEFAEALPVTGSLKFGSHPLGPLMEHAKDISEAISGNDVIKKDLLIKAKNGDKKAIIALGEILGKTFGVTGTAQTAKFARGQMRGDSVGRSLIGRMGVEQKKKISKSSRKARSRSNRRARPLSR